MTLSGPDWRWDASPKSSDDLRTYLDDRMRSLESTLLDVNRTLEFGPVRGAVIPITFSYSNAAGIGTGVKDLVPISFEGKPVELAAFINPGTAGVTIQINNDTTPILSSNTSVANTALLEDRSDFAEIRILPPNLNLEVISVDTGTPIHIRVTLLLVDVTRVGGA